MFSANRYRHKLAAGVLIAALVISMVLASRAHAQIVVDGSNNHVSGTVGTIVLVNPLGSQRVEVGSISGDIHVRGDGTVISAQLKAAVFINLWRRQCFLIGTVTSKRC